MDEVIVLRPEWLLKAPPAPAERGCAVIVRGGKIEAVVGAGGDLPAGDTIDLPGATLLPGLTDWHVHLTLCGCCTPRQTMMQEDDSLLLLRAAENARQALMAGITTLRDCGDRNGVTFTLREAIERGITPGPRLLLAGPPLTSPRGHCYFMGSEVEGREQIARRIERTAARGADFIKVMATGGGMTPGTDSLALQFSRDDLAFIVEESAKHGLPVAAHAHNPESIQACVEAGVRTIEHATFAARGAIHASQEILDRMADRHTIAVPTNIPAVNAVKEGRTLGLARELGLTSEQFLTAREAVLKAFAEAGVRVLAGSDAGATGTPFDSVLGEIELFTGAYTNLQAIAAATNGAAIAPGAAADLLAVSGNPASDIAALRRPRFIMCRGRIERQEAA